MATRRIVTSVAANSTSDNILANDWLRNPQRPGLVSLASTVPAASAGDILCNMELSSDLIVRDAAVPGERAAGTGPILPDNVLAEEGATERDQIIITFTNTSAGAIDVTSLVVFNG